MSSAPTPVSLELPELCRVCILSDARAKATFSDNTILVTNSTGSSFLIVNPDGRATRQLSEYALTRHSPLLAAVLEFRNMHVELPCFCKPLARVLRSGFALGYLIGDATWPNPQNAVESGLAQVQPDGKVAVSSEDGVAQVVLHGHHRRFAVCYPLLVAERHQEAKYEYIWQTQVFSVASHPARWRPAVRAALLAAAQLGQRLDPTLLKSFEQHPHQFQQAADQPGNEAAAGALLSPSLSEDAGCMQQQPEALPGSNALEAASVSGGSNSEAPSRRRTALPRADDCIRSSLAEQLRSDDWWGEPSLSRMPSEDVLLFEWTPQATYQFLPESGEVEVWVHADESCLLSTRGGRFFAHHKDGDAGAQLYAASCVPEAVWSRDQSSRYPLGLLAAHALKLRSHNTTLAAALAARQPAARLHPSPSPQGRGSGYTTGAPGRRNGSGDDLFAVASTTVLEEAVVPGQAHFTAYEDGRVRVCFEDRTILHMSASQSHCKVVQSDGTVVVVAVANPVGVEAYVGAATEFACWAFKTPAERSQELQVQARVRAEILNSQRMVQLCEYSASRALPDAGPPAQLEGPGGEEYAVGAALALPVESHPDPGGGLNDRQAMIENLLNANARLLQRL